MLRDHLHPRGGVHLHQRVRHKHDMHAVEDGRDDRMPQAGIALEVQDADHDLALGVGAGGGEGARHGEHGCARDGDAEDGAVLLRGVLHVGGRVVCEAGRGGPLLGRPAQVLRDVPVQARPALQPRGLAI
jgi:hypothetical protein